MARSFPRPLNAGLPFALLVLAVLSACGARLEPSLDSGSEGANGGAGGETSVGGPCQPNDVQRTNSNCGHNDRGTLERRCSEGRWPDELICVDPDDCKNDAVDTGICLNGGGEFGRTCRAGRWFDDICRLKKAYRASVSSDGDEANELSFDVTVSANGRFVAFRSLASNLVDDDTNSEADVFVHDLNDGTTSRVSVDKNGAQANGPSSWPSLSAEGRFVAFVSDATNLVPDDTNGVADVFIRDLVEGSLRRVSSVDGELRNAPAAQPQISADGRVVAYRILASDEASHVFVHDLVFDLTREIGDASDPSDPSVSHFSISADGTIVAFSSSSALTPNDWNFKPDVFIYDQARGEYELVNFRDDGIVMTAASTRPSISADGRFVAFEAASNAAIGGDGQGKDVFVHDRRVGSTRCLSLDRAVIAKDRDSDAATISADGRYVVFNALTRASAALARQEDTFLHDLLGGSTRRISAVTTGLKENYDNRGPAVSAEGRVVVFSSPDGKIVPNDTNGVTDVFVVPFD